MNIVKWDFESSEVRTVVIDGEPWWIARDVCNVFGVMNAPQAVQILDTDEKLVYVLYISGQNREVNLINESGLYALILRSNKPEAKVFRKWVTSVVLPQIRKTGIVNIVKWDFESSEVRTVVIDGEPWWIARDVCNVLGVMNAPQAVQILDTDEKLVYVLYISGQNREVNLINESGLYALILRSNKPEAKVFRKWVTSVVLPQICVLQKI